MTDAALNVLRKLDWIGRGDDDDATDPAGGAADPTDRGLDSSHEEILGRGALRASAREYISLLARISSAAGLRAGERVRRTPPSRSG